MRNKHEEEVGRMEAALAGLEIHLGFPERREELARRLVGADITTADVTHVGRTVGTARNRSAALAKVLDDPDEVRKRVDDVKHCDKSKQPESGPPAGQGHGQVHAVDDAWNQRKAFALVRVDGKSAKFVAELMQSTIDQVNKWCDAEVALRQQDNVARKRAPEEETHDQRVTRFRKMMEERS